MLAVYLKRREREKSEKVYNIIYTTAKQKSHAENRILE